MKKFLLAGLALFSFQTIAFSQENLIPNGSFEDVAALPLERGHFYLAQPWSSTAAGRGVPADLFHKKSRSYELKPSINYTGHQEPRTGEAYGGISILRAGSEDYREFIMVRLAEPLEKDALYEAEFYVSLAEYSELATSGIGFFVSQRAPLLLQNGFLMAKPQVELAPENIITDRDNWTKISGQFKAAGGETTLTIGNFQAYDKVPRLKVVPAAGFTPRKKTAKEKILSFGKESDEGFAYYYIDDISLVKVGDRKPEIIAQQPEPAEVKNPEPVAPKNPEVIAKRSEYFGEVTAKKTIRLNKIFFQPDKSVLLPASFPELDKLYGFLTENPTVSIQINGHTDITNLPDYNQTLSENRAKAVKFYLIRKGIAEKRIKTKGFGETQPVATNETEEGKQQNRRVEFEILP
ncbi:OmpA family protein [Adhaeribacter sp. BT258]|uniref:OmpA family protein n=1 Tax=Adhaeribacter terrigena TaxID=2793070 RepID=A0ABS1C521_9BACT|nr:OmpA family protein [Adhaeribacter terrigena]MBK0403743.1 OmpA family protein [Adhaeribacter terrigena]